MTGITSVCAAAVLACVGVSDALTSDHYQITQDQPLALSGLLSVQTAEGKDVTANAFPDAASSAKAEIRLFGAVPVKTVTVQTREEISVIPCGTPFGIKMFTNGVVIVGVADVRTQQKVCNPAAEAGVKVGDIITQVNGNAVNRNEEIAQLVQDSRGDPLVLSIQRGETAFTATLQPVLSEVDHTYKAGLWVRDSTAGIGTVTFYDPSTQTFGGLGHPICDTDTGEIMPLLNGDIVPVTISGVMKGKRGTPGELRGYFSTNEAMGSLFANGSTGVYGKMDDAPNGDCVPVAMKQTVEKGEAKILATIDSGAPTYYDIRIESIDYRSDHASKNMVVRITDSRLLDATGGIVQGMSGSPILQNGKLVGAVTHVFVNDPTRGYGIFAENMVESAYQANAAQLGEAS